MVHQLKIQPKWFIDVATNRKKFELRYNDRDFKIGDIIVLKEYQNKKYTGREIKRKVNYILHGDGTLGLSKGYCILGLDYIRDQKIK